MCNEFRVEAEKAGLLLGTTSAFITTVPPLVNVVNYNNRGSYILLCASYRWTLGGLVVGSTIVYIGYHAKREWFWKVRSISCCTP